MEVYRRIVERVRGALWAHHRRLLPERQFHRLLSFVHSNKYEHQIRLDRMSVVGRAWGGRVEAVATPSGFVRRVRISPRVAALSPHRRRQLVLAAAADAARKGRRLMEAAETNVYKQFLKDLRPVVMGIRDNPAFFTAEEGDAETRGGTLRAGREKEKEKDKEKMVHRTIPAARAHGAAEEVRARVAWEKKWMASAQGRAWARTLRGKSFVALHGRQQRPRGAPGAKKEETAMELQAPFTPMDEERLLKKNWMAYLDNKHVAEVMWTRAKIGDREKQKRRLQETGRAWHRPINSEAGES